MYGNCLRSDFIIKYGEFVFHNVTTWRASIAELLSAPLAATAAAALHQSLSATERQRSTTHISVTEADKKIHRSLLLGGLHLPIA